MLTYGKGTYSVSGKDTRQTWYIVDAEDEILGRLSSRIAGVLRGKHRPDFTPHLDLGDSVIVVNASKIKLTGKKLEQKTYFRHTLYPGGGRFTSLETLLDKNPAKVIELAVRGMLPKTTLGRQLLGKLRVYADADHPHAGQGPEPLPQI
jgi:large subunit ribosomal protein L13